MQEADEPAEIPGTWRARKYAAGPANGRPDSEPVPMSIQRRSHDRQLPADVGELGRRPGRQITHVYRQQLAMAWTRAWLLVADA
jgi:hypothetical protein